MKEELIKQEAARAVTLAQRAIDAVVGGEADPVQTYAAIRRMEEAIKIFKDDERVRNIVLNEIDKYGKDGARVGDCTLRVKEAGTRYDYSVCCDPTYEAYLETERAVVADRKDREAYLKALPASGQLVVIEDTGEVCTIYPPVKTSKTTIEATFKK